MRILPTTLRELRPTLADLELLVDDATPVVRDLRPAARALGPTLTDAVALAPELEGLFRDVDRRDRRVAHRAAGDHRVRRRRAARCSRC